ncbi:hypothetical protein CAEBREN_22025 [Caenorhabditis brenneri]|uniref:Uncharacterized protein n=1 Tax=Caenorhabditis brenneri TaxID=135651 RepID=G0NY28_CAEBE|nr:hypothetical protein CAEBREN_22025 [Caenorhabditis brenneri]
MAPSTIAPARASSRQTKVPKKFEDFDGYFSKLRLSAPSQQAAPVPKVKETVRKSTRKTVQKRAEPAKPAPVVENSDSDEDEDDGPLTFHRPEESLQDIQDVRKGTEMLAAKKDVVKAIYLISMTEATLETFERFNVLEALYFGTRRKKLDAEVRAEVRYVMNKIWGLQKSRSHPYSYRKRKDRIHSRFNESNS